MQRKIVLPRSEAPLLGIVEIDNGTLTEKMPITVADAAVSPVTQVNPALRPITRNADIETVYDEGWLGSEINYIRQKWPYPSVHLSSRAVAALPLPAGERITDPLRDQQPRYHAIYDKLLPSVVESLSESVISNALWIFTWPHDANVGAMAMLFTAAPLCLNKEADAGMSVIVATTLQNRANVTNIIPERLNAVTKVLFALGVVDGVIELPEVLLPERKIRLSTKGQTAANAVAVTDTLAVANLVNRYVECLCVNPAAVIPADAFLAATHDVLCDLSLPCNKVVLEAMISRQ